MNPIKGLPKQASANPFFAASHIYAVLDGAAIPSLLDKLYKFSPEHICLYRGELGADLAHMAPYLVRLENDTEFTNWILSEGWGHHWGIFAATNEDMLTMRKHFRTFLMVESPEGKPLYFRYYDPRVFRQYLPTCGKEQANDIFGPILFYMVEGEKPGSMLRFSLHDGLPYKENIKVQ